MYSTIVPESRQLAILHQDRPLQIEYFLRPGRGKPLLYLHGLGCGKRDFIQAAIVQELQSHALAALDFPGCGGSPYPEDMRLGMDDLVEITNTFVSNLGLQNTVVIGHSMGGLVALLYARQYPERVKGLINVEGNLAAEDCIFSRKLASHSVAELTSAGLDDFKQKLARSENRGFREFAKTLESASARAISDYSAALVDYSDNADLLQLFTSLGVPKLFVYGSENCGLTYLPKLKESTCKTVEIRNSNHFPFHDNPHEYYRAISFFLNVDIP